MGLRKQLCRFGQVRQGRGGGRVSINRVYIYRLGPRMEVFGEPLVFQTFIIFEEILCFGVPPLPCQSGICKTFGYILRHPELNNRPVTHRLFGAWRDTSKPSITGIRVSQLIVSNLKTTILEALC